jgi:hypothetical protein
MLNRPRKENSNQIEIHIVVGSCGWVQTSVPHTNICVRETVFRSVDELTLAQNRQHIYA